MGKYTTRKNQTIEDVAVAVYGHFTGVSWLIRDNELLMYGEAIPAKTELYIRDEKINIKETKKTEKKSESETAVTVKNQNIFDVALEVYGNFEASFGLFKQQKGLNVETIEQTIGKNTTIKAPANDKRKNENIVRKITNKVISASGESADAEQPTAGGIGEMIIESTFTIS
jgi:hypothetical protein